jgi:hemerythrin-like domain-containing protein
MKRHDNLQPISRQHHNLLLGCLLLKKGVRKKADLQVMQDFIKQLWKTDLSRHVALEEKNLLPFLMRYPSLHCYAAILHNEHELIERIYERNSNGQISYRNVEILAETLEHHIRFEERVLFERLQLQLPDEIDKIVVEEDSGATDCSLYPVKFWE